MEESSTYQAIFRRGFEQGYAQGIRQGARRAIVVLGTHRFGPPSKEIAQVVESINEMSVLEELTVQGIQARTWTELLSGVSCDCTEGS